MKPKTARAVHANRGIEASYREKLQELVDQMHASFAYWIKAAYKRHPPRVASLIAEDAATHSQRMQKVLRELGERWIAKFDEAAPKIAEAYLQSMFDATDNAFRRALKDGGFAVEFSMTPAIRDAFQASLADNIGLIKSIPAQYHRKVEGVIMRGYAAGRDLSSVVDALTDLYPEAAHRAVLIARDQSNKANSVVVRTRRLELGLTKAIWQHSHAGKTPRQSHVDANNKEFDVDKGMLIDGEYIQPGEKINCRCTSRTVLPI